MLSKFIQSFLSYVDDAGFLVDPCCKITRDYHAPYKVISLKEYRRRTGK